MILFIGDKPSKRTDPNVPFKGAACEPRLIEWICVVAGNEPYAIFNRKDIVWEHFQHENYKVVALGNAASTTLSQYDIPHFKLPHPSGRNRQINHIAFINEQLELCKKYIQVS